MNSNGTLLGLLGGIIDFINGVLVYLVFSLAFIFFLWGVFKYFIAGGANDESREEGKKFISWGIVAFAVMISVWGLVNILVNTFGFGGASRPCLPTFGNADCSNGGSSTSQPLDGGQPTTGPSYAVPTKFNPQGTLR